MTTSAIDMHGIDDVVFVVEAPRSGTTLFRLILDSHPRVVNPGEFRFLFEFVTDDAQLPDVNKYKEWLSTDRIFLDRYIHLLRDPRDVALSTILMGLAGNTYLGVDLWVETEKSWDQLASKLQRSRIPAQNAH